MTTDAEALRETTDTQQPSNSDQAGFVVPEGQPPISKNQQKKLAKKQRHVCCGGASVTSCSKN